jgi:hypothetical protein
MKTLAERLRDVRDAWAVYQADAARANRADVPSLVRYWEAVRACAGGAAE